MHDATLQPAVYKARRNDKHLLMGAAFVLFGLAFGAFAHVLGGQVAHPLRRSGYLPAVLWVLIGLYLIVQTGLRFPRIYVGPSGVAVKGMFAEDRAAWNRLGPFEVEARPFNVYFGNDIVSAAELDGGRFSIGLRPFDVNAHALMMELNKWRVAATPDTRIASFDPHNAPLS